jgi:hypothetical protein
METEEHEIERVDTGIRFLLTLLFFVIARVMETILAVVILFDLIYVAITKSPPPERLRGFANRAIAYFYRVGRYLIYAEADAPFPFSDFPDEIEPLRPTSELVEEAD